MDIDYFSQFVNLLLLSWYPFNSSWVLYRLNNLGLNKNSTSEISFSLSVSSPSKKIQLFLPHIAFYNNAHHPNTNLLRKTAAAAAIEPITARGTRAVRAKAR